jgi:hypothetical protein
MVDAVNIGCQELTGEIVIGILKGMQVPDEVYVAFVGGEVSAGAVKGNGKGFTGDLFCPDRASHGEFANRKDVVADFYECQIILERISTSVEHFHNDMQFFGDKGAVLILRDVKEPISGSAS